MVALLYAHPGPHQHQLHLHHLRFKANRESKNGLILLGPSNKQSDYTVQVDEASDVMINTNDPPCPNNKNVYLII